MAIKRSGGCFGSMRPSPVPHAGLSPAGRGGALHGARRPRLRLGKGTQAGAERRHRRPPVDPADFGVDDRNEIPSGRSPACASWARITRISTRGCSSSSATSRCSSRSRRESCSPISCSFPKTGSPSWPIASASSRALTRARLASRTLSPSVAQNPGGGEQKRKQAA